MASSRDRFDAPDAQLVFGSALLDEVTACFGEKVVRIDVNLGELEEHILDLGDFANDRPGFENSIQVRNGLWTLVSSVLVDHGSDEVEFNIIEADHDVFALPVCRKKGKEKESVEKQLTSAIGNGEFQVFRGLTKDDVKAKLLHLKAKRDGFFPPCFIRPVLSNADPRTFMSEVTYDLYVDSPVRGDRVDSKQTGVEATVAGFRKPVKDVLG
jgi:hypothetical protein